MLCTTVRLSLCPGLTSRPRWGAGWFQGFRRGAHALCTFPRFLWVQAVGTCLSPAR